MRRVLFDIPLHYVGLPDIPVYGYGFMMMLGFLAAIMLAVRLARREGIPAAAIYDISLIAVLSGVVGARLMWLLRFAPEDLPPSQYIAVWNGGLVFYGGLLLALALGLGYCWQQRLPVARTADCFAPAAMVGLAFGRMGCFLNGCCYGTACSDEAWYGVRFPGGSPAAMELWGLESGRTMTTPPLYPSQLMSSFGALVVAGLLLFFWRHRRFPGQVTLLMLVLYGVNRFTVEFFRGDTVPRSIGPLELKEGQIVAAITVLAAGFLLAILWRRAGKAPPSGESSP
jgi:phosphatidylglycerol:prolipoprotein diacylglycerol transferase